MRSPAGFAGLRGVATLLWLHFVASPQRVPESGCRRWGRTVVNVIDRCPPLRSLPQPRCDPVAASLGDPAVAGRSNGESGCTPTTHSTHGHRSAKLPTYRLRLRRAGMSFNVDLDGSCAFNEYQSKGHASANAVDFERDNAEPASIGSPTPSRRDAARPNARRQLRLLTARMRLRDRRENVFEQQGSTGC